MKKIKMLLSLFLSMIKIGAFTFGGGYAMINLLDHEFVSRKKWIGKEEFLDLVTIAESTPGPIAINCSTYIGYKKGGILGSVVSTIGMVLPSITVIYVISLFFDTFISTPIIAAAFEGIQVCVVFLIFSAGIKIFKKLKKTPFNITITSLTIACMLVTALLSVSFSSIFYVLISGGVGALAYTVRYFSDKNGEKGCEVEK